MYKITLFFLFACSTLFSQQKVLVNIQSAYQVSSKDNLQPHYQYANQWGIQSPFDDSQALVLTGFKYSLLTRKNIKLDVGVSGVLKDNTEDSFLHEAYVNGKIFNLINLSVGKHAYSPISYNDQIMVGGFMRNANARPIPRAQIGIFDYQPVSFLNGIVEVKGGLSHGILNDDRTASGRPNSADKVQVHEKWAYVKAAKLKVQPYVGLFHAALIGGKRANGTEIPVDYWATFFGQPSEEVGGGDATNVAGGHDGFWDLGFYTHNSLGKFHFYLQKPFADRTGLRIWRWRNHDYKIGVLTELAHCKLVNNISVELFKTDYQAGSGLPDPIYPEGHPKAGQILFTDNVSDYDAFMLETFGLETDGYTRNDLVDYLKLTMNNGRRYGERDDYNNNGMYYNAWTYHQQAMGMPLYHTYWQAKAYAPEWTPNNHVVFLNNRVKGFHLGVEGEIADGLSYVLKTTFSNNFGSYGEEYVRRYSWVEDPDFFYKGGKKQTYTHLAVNYKNRRWKTLSLQASVSYDTGELYDALGGMIGIKYTPSLSVSKGR